MAKFEDSMSILMDMEFSSPKNALEKNKTEDGYTFMGVYRAAHPDIALWDVVDEKLRLCEHNVKEASVMLYNDPSVVDMVADFYFATFWKPYRLKELVEQKKADEIFIFGVNAGMKKAIKIAQQLVGVEADGVVGPATIGAINKYDVDEFDREYDELEKAHYDAIVAVKPEKRIFANGWRNRAEAV